MVEINEYDRQVYQEIQDFLPNRIIDCHTHVLLREFYKPSKRAARGAAWANMGDDQCSVEELMSAYDAFFSGKTVTPVLFGTANKDVVREMSNRYVKEQGVDKGFPSLLISHPDMTPDELDSAFDSGFKGIKPYLSNAPDYIPEEEIRIFDFLPHHHLELVDRRKGVVMMHIPRPKRLRDGVNIAQLLEIEERYPNLKLIVAHVGRAYAPEDFGDAFERLSKTSNMLFDFSANTLDEAIRMALNTFGPKRVMFGSDMSVTTMRMRRIVENGVYINLVPPGLYGDITGNPHMREVPGENLSFFMYEIIRAAKRAMTGFSTQDIEDVFYNNAKRVFEIQ